MALDLLAGLKVLDLGRGISGPFCAKLFADLGAVVVKVEPPGGDPARQLGPFPDDLPHPEKSGLFLALNTNKLGVTLDLEAATGQELLLQLVRDADLLVENFPPGYLADLGLDYAALATHNSRLVFTSVTPFGQTGPWAGYQANNLILSNVSGHSIGHPGPVDDPEAQPPLQLAAHQAEFVSGLTAATAALVALNRRRVTGIGGLVDVAGMEALALLPQSLLAEFSKGIPPKGRHRDQAERMSLLALLPCRDGYVGLSPRQEDQWERFVALMGNPTWAADPKFATRDSRLEYWNDLEPLLSGWTARHTKEEVYRMAQGEHIPSFPLNTAADLFNSAQFQARRFFVDAEHPVAGKLPYPGWPIQLGSGKAVDLAPAPLLGQDNGTILGTAGRALPPETHRS